MFDIDLYLRWQQFLAGQWQKSMPTRPGVYAQKARTPKIGNDGSCFGIILLKDGVPTPNIKWDGWWWSKPWPDLPAPPDWDST